MTSLLLDAPGRRFLEKLLRPSVVLIRLADRPVATGFFISRGGWVCTAWHAVGLDPSPVRVEWEGGAFQAEVELNASDLDLLVLRPAAGVPALDVPPLPVATDRLDELSHDLLATVAYAIDPAVQLRPRLYFGSVTETARVGSREEIVFQDLVEGDGISGAPILDLSVLRVAGHVTFAPAKLRRLGGGTAARHLSAAFPALAEEWRQAGERLERRVADFLSSRGGLAIGDPLPPRVRELLIRDHNHRIVQDYRQRNVFDPDRYAPRWLESEISQFLEQEDAAALMVAGLTGSGKTNLLLHLSESLDPEVYLPVVLPCRNADDPDLLRAGFAALGLPYFTPAAAVTLLGTFPGRSWVFLFEGLNEWPSFRLEHFRQTVLGLASLIRERGARNLKVIFSVRSEFLQERLVDFRAPGSAAGGPLEPCMDLFFQARVGLRLPFLELICSEKPAEGEATSELQVLYDHYRLLPGHRPKTTFDQLSEPVRRMISLPLLLAIFVQRYNGKEVPEVGLRSSLIEDIILPILNQRGEASEVFRQDAGDFLKGLAGLVFERQDAGLGRPYREVKRQPWQDRFILETLLSASPILSCTRAERDDLYISFRSDWFYEHSLAGHLWDQHYREGGEISTEILHQILHQATDSRAETHLARAFVFLSEWALARGPWRPGLILRLLALEERLDFARGFVQSLLELVQRHIGFAKAIETEQGEPASSFVELLDASAEVLPEAALRRLIDYAESLEIPGDYGSILDLLNVPARLWSRPLPRDLAVRRLLAIAYSLFSIHDIEAAYQRAQDPVLGDLPAELAAKRQFVLGRCLQHQQRYPDALSEYAKGVEGSSPFAYRCRHQSAFIKFLAESDYQGARAELEAIIPNPHLAEEEDQGSEPRLLHATCLVNLGEYAAAEAALERVAEARRRTRRSHKEGTACRALADLHFRRFRRGDAVAAIGRAIECLETCSHYLSFAYALEVEASILALLEGATAQAVQRADRAIEISRGHLPTLSWALQTRALVGAVAGEDDAVSDHLAEARRQGLSPYQEAREQFVLLLRDFLGRRRPEPALAGEALTLRRAYEGQGWRWYPAILGLMLASLAGETPSNPAAARTLFGEDIEGEGLTRSYLFARIFPSV